MSEVLPPGWAVVPLGRVAHVQLGKMLSAAAKTGQGTRPYLRNINVRWHRIDVDDVFTMDFNEREAEKFALRVGDVLVCEGGEPGRAAVWKDQLPGALYQKALHRVRFIDGAVDPNFFVYQLELLAATGDLARGFTGSTIKHLPREAFVELPLRVPPVGEQRRIVAAIEEHLSALDAAVTGLKRARANIVRFRAAALDEAVCAGRQALPTGWRWMSLGDLADVQGGIQKQPKRAPRSNHYPFLRVANVHRGRLVLDEVHRIELFGAELSRLRLEPGDLLIVEGNGSQGEIGRMAVWDGSIDDCVHQNHIIRARPRPDALSEYLAIYWNSPAGSRRVQAVASSTSGLHTLSVAKVKGISVPLPPLEEQVRIIDAVGGRLDVVDRTAAEIDVQLARAARLRQSILHRAFSGSLVPQDPADEPADELLARVSAHSSSHTPSSSTSRAPKRATTSRRAHG